jgi:hypothetical protein
MSDRTIFERMPPWAVWVFGPWLILAAVFLAVLCWTAGLAFGEKW